MCYLRQNEKASSLVGLLNVEGPTSPTFLWQIIGWKGHLDIL